MPIPGETFSKGHVFTAESIAAFAAMAGDWNPLHHDPQMAKASRFGGLIASGTQTSAMLMGLAAEHLSQTNDVAGLEFTFRFRRALPAGLEAIFTWRIAAIERSEMFGGDIVILTGEITDSAGQRYVTADGRAVIWPRGQAARTAKE